MQQQQRGEIMHIFDPEIAAKVGVNAAVLFQNIRHWCEKNMANEHNIHDGHAWTYNSRRAFVELFPYLTDKQVRVGLKKLEDEGLIITGNFNADARDRTKWFAVPSLTNALDPEGQSNIGPQGPTITRCKPDTTSIISARENLEKPVDVSAEVWADFLTLRKAKKAPLTATALKGVQREAEKAGMTLEAALEVSVTNGWQGFKADWVKGKSSSGGGRRKDGFSAALDAELGLGGQ